MGKQISDEKRMRIARIIKEVAYFSGDFTLRSGRRSDYIIDKYAFETRPDVLGEIAEVVTSMIPEGTNRIAGVELGGVPLATAVSLASGIPFLIVKKAKKGYGTDKRIEGELEKGDRVALIEDVATTAGTACDSARLLLDSGAGSVFAIVVVDRQEGAEEGFADAGLEYAAVVTKQDLDKC